MSLISVQEVREAGAATKYGRVTGTLNKSASSGTARFSESAGATDEYDIFLSHTSADKTLIKDLVRFLEQFDLSVYVDWINDPQLDRTRVTKSTAATLRDRMKQCRGLLFATSNNAEESIWMPWELGYFDACKGRCAIIPLTARKGLPDYYPGQEYLGLYPYVTRSNSTTGTDTLWVETRVDCYVNIHSWLSGVRPFIHS